MKTEADMHTGSCLCGGVTFCIDAALAPIEICHCSQCRKAQGTPFATNTPVAATAFRLTGGTELLKAFSSSPGKQRVFCSRCGSPVYSSRASAPGVVRVRAGLIDEPLEVSLAAHAHMASRCSWWPVNDGLPQHAQAMDTAGVRGATPI